MLVLTRKVEEKVQIGPDVTITILRVKGRAVQIGIEAPDRVLVLRGELAAAAELRAEAEESLNPSDPTVAALETPAAASAEHEKAEPDASVAAGLRSSGRRAPRRVATQEYHRTGAGDLFRAGFKKHRQPSLSAARNEF